MSRPSFIICVFLLLVACPVATHATQILYKNPRQLGQESSLVARGKVASVTSYWNEQRTKILTKTRIEIEETYKGIPLPDVEVVQLGGTVGNIRVTVAGALTWNVGEEVLVFLEPNRANQHRVTGFSQGKFYIERDPKTGAAFVRHPEMDGVEIRGAPASDVATEASETVKIPLAQFVEEALGGR